MKDIGNVLRFLGIGEAEIKTYGSALQKGSSTVADLAKHTGLSRQAVYDAIASLTERGLMSSIEHEKKRLFVSEDPEKLLAYARRRETEFKEQVSDLAKAVPQLSLSMGGKRPSVRVYEGKEAIQAYLSDVQKEKPKVVYEIADTDAMYELLAPKDLEPVRNELKRHKTEVEGIYLEKTPRPHSKKSFSLPKEKDGVRADITLYNDKIAFVSFEGRIFSILIENAPIAKALRRLFELALKQASKETR